MLIHCMHRNILQLDVHELHNKARVIHSSLARYGTHHVNLLMNVN